jgi:hypothetical protein
MVHLFLSTEQIQQTCSCLLDGHFKVNLPDSFHHSFPSIKATFPNLHGAVLLKDITELEPISTSHLFTMQTKKKKKKHILQGLA